MTKPITFQADNLARAADVTACVADTFTTSEDATEGARVGQLTKDLMETVEPADRLLCTAETDTEIIGAVIFTRLRYPEDPRVVFLLSPMAIATGHQGRGLGQKLITYGLDKLRAKDVSAVLTYGNINFYAKVGFAQITAETAQPPLPLSYPTGWLGQSLMKAALHPSKGPSTCVTAFRDPALW